MNTILIAASSKRRFLDLYTDWRRAAGDSIVTLPVEGPHIEDVIYFGLVPTEFLAVLTANAIAFAPA